MITIIIVAEDWSSAKESPFSSSSHAAEASVKRRFFDARLNLESEVEEKDEKDGRGKGVNKDGSGAEEEEKGCGARRAGVGTVVV